MPLVLRIIILRNKERDNIFAMIQGNGMQTCYQSIRPLRYKPYWICLDASDFCYADRVVLTVDLNNGTELYEELNTRLQINTDVCKQSPHFKTAPCIKYDQKQAVYLTRGETATPAQRLHAQLADMFALPSSSCSRQNPLPPIFPPHAKWTITPSSDWAAPPSTLPHLV